MDGADGVDGQMASQPSPAWAAWAERDTATDRTRKRVSGAAAMLIPTPIPRLDQGVACGQSQWAARNALAKTLTPSSCLVVLVWSCLAWSSKAVFVVCTFGRWSHRPPPRPKLLFDAPALTGHASARPGNPSDISHQACKKLARSLQETQNIRNTPARQTDGQTSQLVHRIALLHSMVGGRAGGRWIAVLPIDHQSPGTGKAPLQTNLERPTEPCAVGPARSSPRLATEPHSHRHQHRRRPGTWAVCCWSQAQTLGLMGYRLLGRGAREQGSGCKVPLSGLATALGCTPQSAQVSELGQCRLLYAIRLSACLYALVPCTCSCPRRATLPSVPGYPPTRACLARLPALPLRRAACSKQEDPKKVLLDAADLGTAPPTQFALHRPSSHGPPAQAHLGKPKSR